MRVTCSTCGSELDIDPAEVVGSRTVRCHVCHSVVVLPSDELALEGASADGSDLQLDPGSAQTLSLESPPRRPEQVSARSSQSAAPGLSARSAPGRASVSVQRHNPRRFQGTLSWSAFVTVVMIAAGYAAYRRMQPPPPPRMANPLELEVKQWRSAGIVQRERAVAEAVALASDKLRKSRPQRWRALRAIREGLLGAPGDPQAVALFARALAELPDAQGLESVAIALRAVTATIGDDPGSDHRADLEEARAWLLLQQGRFEAARRAALSAEELDPDAAGVRLVKAAVGIEFRSERSVPALEGLLADPDLGLLARRWLAESQLRSGQVTNAVETLNAGIAVAPRSDRLMRPLYRLRLALGEREAAVALLEGMVQSRIAAIDDRIVLARLYARDENRIEDALVVLDGGLDQRDLGALAAARAWAEKVIIATSASSFSPEPRELVEWLDAAERLDPDASIVMYAGALAELSLGHQERALDALEVANGRFPHVPEMAIQLAWLLRELDQAAAVEVVNDALSETLDSVGLYAMSALLAFDRGKRVKAFQRIKRALAIDPEVYLASTSLRDFPVPRDALIGIGNSLVERGRESRNAVMTSAGAAAYYVGGDLRRSARALTQALRLDPRDASAHLYSGILAQRRGQLGAWRTHLNVAWDHDRGLPLVQIYHARLQERLGNTDKAEMLYREILRQNASSTSAQNGLARVLWLNGKSAEALIEAKKVLAVRPEDREALTFLSTRGEE